MRAVIAHFTLTFDELNGDLHLLYDLRFLFLF